MSPVRTSLFAMLASVAVCASAQAAAIRPFSLAALQAAQAQGLPVLVDAHADWCPICKAQGPTLTALANDPAFGRLVILRLDYDRQAAEKKALGIRMQSTLIAYKGAQETGRLVGVSDAQRIRDLAGAALR